MFIILCVNETTVLSVITLAMMVKVKWWMFKQIQPTLLQPLIQRGRNLSMMIVTGLKVIF